jgi:2-polyprenyl-3-methyl-5-hydroxy-6-metoxy-1,4-benzoquinol methylase
MGFRQWLGFYTTKRFSGSWDLRLTGLFDCGVDFAGKTVLDVGCNIGIVAYEVSKRAPAFIHGIDNYRGALRIARAIFRAVTLESRFDRVDLRNETQLQKILRPSYDIVLLLETYHAVRHKDPAAAARAVEIVAARAGQTLLVRSLPSQAEELYGLIERQGFSLVGFDTSAGDPRTARIARFDRVR